MRITNKCPALLATVSLFLLVAEATADDRLCPTTQQIDTIKELKRTSPGLTPAQIALQTRLPEAAVVFAMDLDSRIAVEIRQFDRLWDSVRNWEAVRLVAYASGSEFEVHGKLPPGETEFGFFNYFDKAANYGGRLKRDRIGIIYLLTTPGNIGDEHQVAVFDRDGRRVFAIFVPREAGGSLQKQPYRLFQRLRNEYSGRYPVCD